jgi:predicted metal-dependent peptidase
MKLLIKCPLSWEDIKMQVNENIVKAKAALIVDQPFFASILLGLSMTEDSRIKTMATNGDEIRYNPEFAASLSLSEMIFVMAHETMHCVFQHMYRRGNKNHNKYNIAADYIINDLLAQEKIGTMPQGCLMNSALVQQGGYTTEGVYNLLPDSDESKQAGDMGNGGSMDDVIDAGKDEAEMSQKEAEMRVKVVQASNAAKMCGKLSQNMARVIGDLTSSKVDWRAVLRRFLSERAKVDLSYAKPKRRFMAEDIYLPSLNGEKMGSVVVGIDCSGSINGPLLDSFASEVKSIVSEVMPAVTHIVYFDSEVLRQDSFTPDSEIEIKPCGGGGTAFSPIFRYIDKENLEPSACVVLTDLECSDFGECPNYPVLWASTAKGNAPFGETVLIKE